MSFKSYSFLFGLFSVAAAAQELSDERIINGVSIDIQAVPWQIALLSNSHIRCGGSILSDRIILTAAHCVSGLLPVNLTVRAGSRYCERGGQLLHVQDFKIHDGYKTPFYDDVAVYDNDVAVVRLTKPLIFGPAVRSINLAQQNPKNGQLAEVSGWGVIYDSRKKIFPKDLQSVHVGILDRKTCLETSIYFPNEITDDMICASSPLKDACSGDSGGPLVVNGIQVGVVSSGEGCGRHGLPGVYASVAFFYKWIQYAIDALEKRQ